MIGTNWFNDFMVRCGFIGLTPVWQHDNLGADWLFVEPIETN
jgi:hypothetical protein